MRLPWTKEKPDKVPILRRDRTLLHKFREDRYKSIVEEHRANQIGDDALYVDQDKLKRYEQLTDETVREAIGLPPSPDSQVLIEKRGDSILIKPLFTPSDLPIDAQKERSLLTNGIKEAEEAMKEFYEDKDGQD